MKEKIGLFICRCGENIAGVVDVDELAQRLRQDAEVAFVAEHALLCAPDGKAFLAEQVKESGATHVVIAACSPKDHEAEFQRVVEGAGMNKFLLQMANIREHCTWVTRNADAAFDKSLAMIKAAVRRVRLHELLEEKEVDCNPDVLVIGGGIAGIEAALLAAEAGRQVTLVDTDPSVGGMAPLIEEVAPNMECAPCMLSPRLDELNESEQITLLTNTDVTEILGYLGNFEVTVEKRARLVDEETCIGCDECINACPVSVPDERQFGLGDRKAIHVPYPGCVPNCAVIDRTACLRFNGEECTACAEACPMESLLFEQADEKQKISAGAIILATGHGVYGSAPDNSFQWKSIRGVYIMTQFERLTSNFGPTGGKVLKADGTPPRHIAVVHCVGRQELGYCSGVCCQTAMKVGLLAGDHDGEGDDKTPAPRVTHLHTDLLVAGWLGQSLYQRTVNHGSAFVHIKGPETVKIEQSGEEMVLQYRHVDGTAQTLAADMVVLATGLVPSAGTRKMAGMLELTQDDAGFVAPDHPLLRPGTSSLEGVFLAGTVSGPKNIADSIAQAKAAAGTAISRVQPGKKLTLEVITAHADNDLCSKCLVCVSVCPYRACVYTPAADQVGINEVLCHGCGTCVAGCASGAAQARQFTDQQLAAEVKEVLNG